MTALKLLFFQLVQANAGSLMPPAVTDIAKQVTNLYTFLVAVSAISCVILIGGMVYFVIKYRRKSGAKSAYILHSTALEFLWSAIPLVIFMVVFGWGWKIYHEMRTMPANGLEIHVKAKQWAWEFTHNTGKVTTNEIWVPVNTPVKLIMTSLDVIHSFYVPSMRIKQDVVPGRYTDLWFVAEKLGDFQLFCTEFCGTAHSAMMGKIHVVSQADYEAHLQETDAGLSLAALGAKYFNSKTCVACHTVDGTPRVGPTWKGLYGSKREFDDNTSAIADDNYLRESILEPNAHTVKGFPKGAMPPFQGQLKEDEISALIEYIKELK